MKGNLLWIIWKIEKLLFPKFSICDPTVIHSLPKRQLQNGVVDAYTHVLEQYLTYPHEGYLQDRIAESILQTLIEIEPKVVEYMLLPENRTKNWANLR